MIGEVLRSWRIHKEISVRDAAKLFGVSPATLSRIERGKPYEALTLLRLIRALFGEGGTVQ